MQVYNKITHKNTAQMELKNKNTQEIATVQRLHVNNDGQIVYKDYNVVGRAPSARFFANNPMLADTMIKDREGWPVLRLSPAWEIVKGSSRRTDEAKPEKPENAAQYKYNIGDLVLNDIGHDTEQHTVTDRRLNFQGKPEYLITGLSGWFGEYCLLPAQKTEATQNTETQTKKEIKTQQTEKQMEHENNTQKKSDNLSDAEKLLQIISNLKGGGNTEINAEQVKMIVLDTLSQLSEKQQKTAIKAAKSATGNAEKCKDYDNILQDVADGFSVYLHGPAGCGKSYTAEQIAADLGLDLYSATTLQFAHDVRGYGDAAGKFVPTSFYHAFVEGGVYFLDEADRSLPDATIVLNTALAQGWYDFPVVGKKNSHENFRFIAAGNTVMNGADSEYVTGMVQDGSFRDRFAAFYELNYCREIELNIAGGDVELVEFVEDVRNALKSIGLKHIVSYRATAYMAKRAANKGATLQNCVFKGLKIDDLRIISRNLQKTENSWFKALSEIVK